MGEKYNTGREKQSDGQKWCLPSGTVVIAEPDRIYPCVKASIPVGLMLELSQVYSSKHKSITLTYNY